MSETRGWWSRTSAVDDGAVAVESDRSWLDDFDFDEVDDEPTDKLGSIWQRYAPSAGTVDDAVRVASAHRLVQGFINTFATGDGSYALTFNEAVRTAGTDFNARKVVVSHRPLFDRTLTADEANTILTAMAVHESSHVRYGRRTAAAIKSHPDPRAARLSNILDDVRIERRFTADYPGYADVFAPAIAYVARSLGDGGLLDPRDRDGCDLVSLAVRYADQTSWPDEMIPERDWWLDWAERGSSSDSPSHHVAAVNEAISHLDAQQQRQEEKESTSRPAAGQDEQSGAGQDEQSDMTDEERDDLAGADRQSEENEAANQTPGILGNDPDETPEVEMPTLPDCPADGIDEAAISNGMSRTISDSAAQELVLRGQALTEPDETGSVGEVHYTSRNIARGRVPIERDGTASAAIRAAFARSRTGHFATEHGLRSGRLDNRSLYRIASDDYRTFARRQAPSAARYRVWLMVDCSGSMVGQPIVDATSVAAALASATRLLPNVALEVWGWTSAFQMRGASFGAVRVYAEGDAIENIGALPRVPRGDTPDAQMLRWAGKAIIQSCRSGETPLLIVASDGTGSLAYQSGNDGIVAGIRKAGVEVLSVAIGRVNESYQRAHFGAHGYVPWMGSISRTAGPLGRIIGRVAAGKGAR